MHLLADGSSSSHTSWLFIAAALLLVPVVSAVLAVARRLDWLPVPAALRGLSRERRRQVARAVDAGVAVDDPALAPAAVRYAETLTNRMSTTQGRPWLVFTLVLALLFVVMAVMDLVDNDYAGTTLSVATVGIWIANPLLARRQYRRAQRAARANRQLLDGSVLN